MKYIAKLKGLEPELLSEVEIADYLHFFTREEIESIYEVRQSPLPTEGA